MRAIVNIIPKTKNNMEFCKKNDAHIRINDPRTNALYFLTSHNKKWIEKVIFALNYICNLIFDDK
jgi:hypothetical protein